MIKLANYFLKLPSLSAMMAQRCGTLSTVAHLPQKWNPKNERNKVLNCLVNVNYYIGRQESTRINGINRSVFNIDTSRDDKVWKQKYRFEKEFSSQFPTFHWHKGHICLSISQGTTVFWDNEYISFGILE